MSNEWICTDPNSSQHCMNINEHTWLYIEAREFGTNYIVCRRYVDILDYTLDELWDYCSGYYNSFERMVQHYGFRETFHIIAECVFEQTDFDEMEYVICKTMGEAIKKVHEFINKYNMITVGK